MTSLFKRRADLVGRATSFAGLAVLGALGLAYPWCNGNRLPLFAIRNDLHIGMPRAEVEEVIARHLTSALNVHRKEGEINVWSQVGVTEFCILAIEFQEGKVATAIVRGEDGPQEMIPGAPPDLGATGG